MTTPTITPYYAVAIAAARALGQAALVHRHYAASGTVQPLSEVCQHVIKDRFAGEYRRALWGAIYVVLPTTNRVYQDFDRAMLEADKAAAETGRTFAVFAHCDGYYVDDAAAYEASTLEEASDGLNLVLGRAELDRREQAVSAYQYAETRYSKLGDATVRASITFENCDLRGSRPGLGFLVFDTMYDRVDPAQLERIAYHTAHECFGCGVVVVRSERTGRVERLDPAIKAIA